MTKTKTPKTPISKLVKAKDEAKAAIKQIYAVSPDTRKMKALMDGLDKLVRKVTLDHIEMLKAEYQANQEASHIW